MAAKATKIEDVKKPDKVAPSASARPIIVTNRPIIASDPMVVPEAEKQPETPQAETPQPPRTIKTIEPISEDMKAPAKSDGEEAVEPAETEPEVAEPEKTEETHTAPEPEAAAETTSEPEKPESEPEEPRRDSEAQTNAAEAAALEAQVQREQELETLIDSGKYAVPLNAVRRKRSRMYTALLCLLALVLAMLLVDAAFDAGVVKAPGGVPHTHFFSNN